MALQIDTTTDFGQRVLRRLQDEQIAWITTLSRDGMPQPNPVWFLWDGESMLIYSRADAVKLQHLAREPRCAVNLEAGSHGEDVVVFTGRAVVDAAAPPVRDNPAYLEKYRQGIINYIGSPEAYDDAFMVAIRFYPEKLRGF